MIWEKRYLNSADVPANAAMIQARDSDWTRTKAASNGNDLSVPPAVFDALRGVELLTRRAEMHKRAGSHLPHFLRV